MGELVEWNVNRMKFRLMRPIQKIYIKYVAYYWRIRWFSLHIKEPKNCPSLWEEEMSLFCIWPCRTHVRHSSHASVLILRAFRGMTMPWSIQGSHQHFLHSGYIQIFWWKWQKWSIVKIICKLNALNEDLSKYFCWAWLTAIKGSTKKEELWTEVEWSHVSRLSTLVRDTLE